MQRCVSLIVILSTLLVSSCGYLLYPERKGNQSGRLDPVVLLLDGAGLLLGVLPGVVAFAVDITNGTIFLSPGEQSSMDKHTTFNDVKSWRAVESPVDMQTINSVDIAMILSEELGYEVKPEELNFYQRGTKGQLMPVYSMIDTTQY
jgi:hypothetical protein